MPNPFCHIELNTTDLGAAKTFYGKLFDWQIEDIPGGGYTFIKVGTGKYREISPLIWILSGLFLLRYAFLGSE